ncbi:MAG TPA: hypothetical protein VFL34_11675 [Candidatus Sulfotelmatobacter sp.]|nr:hypothetical protein [Candidatus Sulfotelmatobacter sp.]
MSVAILPKTLSRFVRTFRNVHAPEAALFVVVIFALASQLAVAADQKLAPNPCKLEDAEIEGLDHDLSVDVLATKEYANTIANMLRREQFEKIDCVADQVRSTKERFSGGTWKIHELYRGLFEPVQYPATHATQEDWKQLFRQLELWQTQRPKSITARVALAHAYINYAYDARGDGFAQTVSDSGWKLFEERIAKARLILEKATALPVTCPEWYVAMLLVAQNQSWEIDQARALYDEGERREPGYYYDARVFAAYLLPKWSGREGDTQHFIEEVSDRVGGDQGDILYFQIAAVDYVVCGCEDSPKLSRERIVRGLEASEKRYGVSMWNLNRVAYLAIYYGPPDVIVADKVMSRIGEQWDQETWQEKEKFDTMKEWAAKSAPYQLKKLQMEASADANSKTPDGIRYHASVEKTYRGILQECVRTDSAGIETWQGKFEVLLTIGAQGTIEDNKIYAMGPVVVCTYHKLLNLKEQQAKAFAAPPQAPYLVRLDLDWADFAPVASR